MTPPSDSPADVRLREEFGHRVRTLRLERGLSQEDLADMADIHRTYLSSVERGQRNVSLENIVAIARALKVKPALFFEGD